MQSLLLLAQETPEAPDLGASMIFLAVALLLSLVSAAGGWMIFQKAGQPGWAALVPLYNLFVLQRIIGTPGWFALLLLVPGVNVVAAAVCSYRLARAFGLGMVGFLALALLPCLMLPALGFGAARYRPLAD